MDAKIRRYQDNLMYSGVAVFVFGVWSLVKTLLALYLNSKSLIARMNLPPEIIAEVGEPMIRRLLVIIAAVLFSFDLALRAWIGFSAIREGQGKKVRGFYLVFAVIYLVVCLDEALRSMARGETQHVMLTGEGVLTFWVIELTSYFAIVMILVYARKIRRLKKRIENGEA